MQPSLWSIFSTFFRIGSVAFGGGYAMVPLFHMELVDKRRWVDEHEFVELLGMAQGSPGPIAANLAVLTGYRVAGSKGAVVGALGAVLPSFLAILAILGLFQSQEKHPVVNAAFQGIRPAVVGLVALAAWRIGAVSLKTRIDAAGAVLGLVLLLLFRWHPIVVILLGGAAGLFAARRREVGRA